MAFSPGSANFIKRLQYDYCQVPFTIYLETFFPAFIKMLIVQNVPFLDDIIRSSGQALAWGPRADGNNRRHGFKTTLRGSANDVTERYSQRALRHVLVITQPLETIGYLFLLYSTADQFFIDWQSLIDFRGTCVPGASLGMVQRSNPTSELTILEGGDNFTLQTATNTIAPMSSGNGFAGCPQGTYTAYLTLSMLSKVGHQNGLRIGLELQIGDVKTTTWSEPVEINPLLPTDLVVTRDFRVPIGTTAQLRWLVGGVTIAIGALATQGRVMVMRTGII